MLPLRDNIPTSRFPVLTVVLIAINVIVFCWLLTLSSEGAGSIDDGPWWVTAFTSMFLDGSILQVVLNMLFLWIFGRTIENTLGRPRFLAFYLLSGIAALYAQTLLEPGATAPMIGASGAVSGILGGYILLHPKARVLTLVLIPFVITFVEIPAMFMLGAWFVLQLLPAVGQVVSTEVAGDGGAAAYLALLGAFLFGMAAIKMFSRGRAGPNEEGPVGANRPAFGH